MSPRQDSDDVAPRFASQGRTYVYVLPCQGEDLLKLGFSRDPIGRFYAFHRRFFTFFDLDRGFLIETQQLREARRIERIFIERWPEHQAPAPLVVRASAGGHTEWFRGLGELIEPLAIRLAERYGHPVHTPLRAWLKVQFAEQADVLYQWSSTLLDMLGWQVLHLGDEGRDPRYQRALLDTLEACEVVGLTLEDLFPSAVLAWRRQQLATSAAG